VWSPTGTRVAYLRVIDIDAQTADIDVVDIASGTDRTVATRVHFNGLGLLGWSPAGDRLLFAGLDDQQGSSLWSINADGPDWMLLVAGADGGGWQPDPIPQADPASASASRAAESPSAARKEVVGPRIWAGIHFRTADTQGAVIGEEVAHDLVNTYVAPVD
jgi:Tol biopolymer transport system component